MQALSAGSQEKNLEPQPVEAGPSGPESDDSGMSEIERMVAAARCQQDSGSGDENHGSASKPVNRCLEFPAEDEKQDGKVPFTATIA